MRDREGGISMNSTVELLRTIGSPFASEQKQDIIENSDEAFKLYAYATKNKIGLLYLETLKNREKLEEFGLQSKYHEECENHDKQVITANRVSKLLNSFDINYAVFKSFMPYPAVPNDVDILHLGSADEYKKAVEIMLRAGYDRIEDAPSPTQVEFHDTRDCEHKGIEHTGVTAKDVYDIDLYEKAAASHIIYLNRAKLAKYVTEIDILGEKVKILEPEAELVALITHSIIPEMLCTLSVYYATLYFLVKMNAENIDRFVYIAKENNVTFPIRTHCSLIAEVHKTAHGFVPNKLEEVFAKLGSETKEAKNLSRANFKMPHRYGWLMVFRTLLERTKDGEFRKGVARQMVSMSSPRFAKAVIKDIIWRSRRETY